ncbi:MAG: hypothetical protein ACK5LP_04045 [Campylobacteraceae bacterium]
MLKKLLTVLLFSTFLFGGQELYLKTNSVLYQDADTNKALGNLIVSSKVTELSKSGEYSKVEFIGYQPEGSEVVYEKVGVIMLGFEIGDASSLKVVGEEKDEYDTVWLKVSATGYVKSEDLGKSKDEISKLGKELFSERCGSCHALHHEDEFDANVWPSILDGMGVMAGLSDNEKLLIEKYLQNYHK